MPSLNALREFKTSFDNVGREKADLEINGLPFNDLELPNTEPEPMEALADTQAAGADDLNLDDLGGLGGDIDLDSLGLDSPSPPAEAGSPGDGAVGDDFDFGAFLDTIPDNLPPPPPADEFAGIDMPAAEDGATDDGTVPVAGDFSVPDGLLSGLSDELEAGSADTGGGLDLDGESPDFGGDAEGIGADESPDPGVFDMGDESLDLGGESLDLDGDAGGGLDLGGESFDLGGDAGDGLDLGGESLDMGGDAGGGLDLGGESLDMGGDAGGGLDLGGESLDMGGDAGGGDLDLGGESFDLGGDAGDGLDLGGESLDLGGDTGGGDLDLGGESFDLGGDAGDGLDLGGENLDLGGESLDMGGDAGGGLDLGGGDLDLGGEGFDMGGDAGGGLDPGGDNFDLGSESLDLGGDAGVSDFDIPEAEPVEDLEALGDSDSLDMGGEISEAAPPEDSFDSFDLGGEDAGIADLGSESADSGDTGGDDFSLPGIDDLFEKKTKTEKPALGKAKAKTGRGRPKAEEEVEEIQLSEEDLDKFQKTLAAYPLNLRIACEELIAEQAVAPDQMSKLVRLLINGAPAKETASLAGSILGKTIIIPRGFEKSTGEALEVEQASLAYIFVHNFLPVLRWVAMILVVAASLGYLIYKFVYTPIRAENLYKNGYERIFAGEYERANQRFQEAFGIHRKKDWFYKYAEAFRDERQYLYAEEKYDELLRFYPRDKKGVLDYAAMETNRSNFDKADRILRRELLDYAPDDREGLLALGDNNLAWGEEDHSKYEEARFAYARLLEKYGWIDPVVERMMRYFIRTDNLKEVIPLKDWFDSNKKRKLSAASMAELGGYLLDKQLEEVRGVPNEYVEKITGVRDLLLKAVRAEPLLPEPHYHLARYYHSLGNVHEERLTLENAIRAFDMAKEETKRRLNYRIDTHRRYADLLINNREFFPAEQQLVKGINLYEDALARDLIVRSPQYGRLYASLGDLEYFVKNGDMEMALNYYHRSEQNGWAPPEIQYRMGAAYYQLEDWKNALAYLFKASADLPLNRRLLYAMGNTALKRGDYFAAQGYYNRLLDILEAQRSRLPVLLPNDRPEFIELGERIMMARNNAGVAYEALANQTGSRSYRSRALALYAESARAWDAITRNPTSMVRLRPIEGLNTPGINLPFLNANNALHPAGNYEPEIFPRIDRDVVEPSLWEQLAPVYSLLPQE